MKYICVFAGGGKEAGMHYKEQVIALGRVIVQRGYGLAYGGGAGGLMKMIADSVIKEGGNIIGIITTDKRERGTYDKRLSNLIDARNWDERKAKMAELATAFIVLPGGYGTFNEFTEMLNINQSKVDRPSAEDPIQPVVFMNFNGFYNGTEQQFARTLADGFITPDHHSLMFFTEDPILAVQHIESFVQPEPVPKRPRLNREELRFFPAISPTPQSTSSTSAEEIAVQTVTEEARVPVA